MKKYLILLLAVLACSAEVAQEDPPVGSVVHEIGSDGVCRNYLIHEDGSREEIPESEEYLQAVEDAVGVEKAFTAMYGHGTATRVDVQHNGISCDPYRSNGSGCKFPDDNVYEWWWDMGLTNQPFFQEAGEVLEYYRDVVQSVGGTFRLDSSLQNNTDIVFYELSGSTEEAWGSASSVNYHSGARDIYRNGVDTGKNASIVDRTNLSFNINILTQLNPNDRKSVVCHEIGHALGLSHRPNSANSCMRKNINPGVFQPNYLSPKDIAKIASFGGILGGQQRVYLGNNPQDAEDAHWWNND